jgi:hypothetical protein
MNAISFNEMTFQEATSAKGFADPVISCRMVLTMRAMSHPVLLRALQGVDKKHWSECILALAERGSHLSFFPESVTAEVRYQTQTSMQPRVGGTVTDVVRAAADSQVDVQETTNEERMDPEDLRMMLSFGDSRP